MDKNFPSKQVYIRLPLLGSVLISKSVVKEGRQQWSTQEPHLRVWLERAGAVKGLGLILCDNQVGDIIIIA